MSTGKRTKKEYGGFLPLELNPGTEYFAGYENSLRRYNTVKAALDHLIRQTGVKRLYIPYYYCPSTTEALRETGAEIRFYHIDEKLMPADLPDEEGSAVLLVDYFGICGEKVRRLADTIQNAECILDLAHGFFEEPVMKPHVHNVYSAKKFFGIPDGAYLISEAAGSEKEEPVNAAGYAGYLLTAYEEGTNAAYKKKKEVDGLLAADYGCMSKLALGLLKNVDYERVRLRRTENYRILREAFEGINELDLPGSCAAYQFPLLISGRGKDIKSALVQEKIFVSTLWAGKDLIENGNAFELSMKDHAVFLPMDQRYDAADMDYVSDRVKRLLEQ